MRIDPTTGVVNLPIGTNYRGLIFSSLLMCAALMSPWLFLVFMAILARGILSEQIGKPILVIVLAGFLALFNATKRIEGDWDWYVEGYLEMSRIGFVDYLQGGGFSVRFTEPIVYALEFVLTRLSGGNVVVLAVAVSLVIYLTYALALEKLLSKYGLYRWPAAACVVFAVLAGVTFTQTLNLVRQYMAGAILFFYLVMLLEGRFKAATILFLVAALIHNSSVFPASLLALCVYIWNWEFVRKRYALVVFSLLVLGLGFGAFISKQILDSPLVITATKDDGAVSMAMLALDGLFFLISFIGVVLLGKRKGFFIQGSAVAVLFMAISLGLLMGMHDLTLWVLRFYFYIEWFRVFGVITIVWFLVHRLNSPLLVLLIIPLSFAMFGLRVAYSPFNYGGGVIEHLSGSAIWWVNNLSEVSY